MRPFINIFGAHISAYGLCACLGILISVALALIDCRRAGKSRLDLSIIAAIAFGCGILGAILLHAAVNYTPSRLISALARGEYRPGFVFYGGLLAGLLGGALGARVALADLYDYIGILLPKLPLAHAFGRLGCFCAGCCYGAPDARFGICFSYPLSDAPIGVPLIPAQLYEAGYNIALCALLTLLCNTKLNRRAQLECYLVMYAFGRFMLERLRYDAARGFLFGASTSQFISAALVLICILSEIRALKRADGRYF